MSSDVPLGEFDFDEMKRMAESGELDEEDMFRIAVVCNKFFWLGWHARGAIEDQDKLSGLAGDEKGSERDDVDDDWSEI